MRLEIPTKNNIKIILTPIVTTSARYKQWVSVVDGNQCIVCLLKHGKILPIEELLRSEPPIHQRCRCRAEELMSIIAGTATVNGNDGADKTLKDKGTLPNYYVEIEYAKEKGWKPGKWPMNFVPDKMIIGGVYKNTNGHLPQSEGRIWYEADINYFFGKRNDHRVVWSNDGLIFVTYDHYKTFYEII